MFRAIKKSLFVGLLAIGVYRSEAFSLMGPLATWQTVQLGYALNTTPFGGPVSVGEEYRWNVPVVYYGFTPEFLSYFGQTGVTEVEKAIGMLNALPAASSLRIDDFPVSSQRLNYRASALGLLDLKSFTLTVLLNELGLADPTRFVFTLRNRWIPAGGAPTNYYVIKRNFDPVTWQHTSYINGQLWTYTTIIDNATGAPDSIAITEPVDPLALLGLINAPVSSGNADGLLALGGYWTTLTRDDVGGLKYIYRNNNYNVENAPPNALSSGGGAGPWGVPGTTTNNTFVNIALRGGVDKIEFQRVNYNSIFGTFTPFTNSYTDTYVTNSTSQTQGLQRPLLVAPDILFDAADLQGADNQQLFITYAVAFPLWIDNSTLNGVTAGQLGPGVINPSGASSAFTLTYQTVGPAFWNVWPFLLSEQNIAAQFFIWGSFDGTTNEPVVYPNSISVQGVEQQVLSGSSGGGNGPFSIP